MGIIKYSLIFILAFYGCMAAGKDKEILSIEAFSWTEKCSLESERLLSAANFYDLHPKNIKEIIFWTNLKENDFFHKKIQKIRSEISENLNMDDPKHQQIILNKFKIEFKSAFTKDCEDFAIPFIRSELERHSAQYFEYNFLEKNSSRKFFLEILYGQ